MLKRTAKQKKALTRTLRKNSTWAERLMWSWLRNRSFSDYKFRRQHEFGEYILDFFCVEAFLNIELDGGGHARPEQQKADEERDKYLAKRGVKTLRFWNSELRTDKDAIQDCIWNELQARAPQPIPDYCKTDCERESDSDP